MSDAELLASEFAAPFPFAAVDAMMLDVITQSKDLLGGHIAFTRGSLTSGSSAYLAIIHLSNDVSLDIGAIEIFMLDNHLTYINPTTTTIIPDRFAVVLQRVLNTIVSVTLSELMRRQAYAKKLLSSPRHKALLELGQDLPISADNIPAPPTVEHDGWESVLIYYALYGKFLGITTDEEIGRAVSRAGSTVGKQRSLLHLARPYVRKKKLGNDWENSGK